MSWEERYMRNMVTIETLNKLVNAGKLTQEEVDDMVARRLEKLDTIK